MARYKTNSKWKKIVCVVLVIGALIAVCAGLAVFTKKETKTIGARAFEIGALDENGKFVENSQSIFTKEAFGCIGLRVEPDFKFRGTYDVYYYDYDGRLLDSIKGLCEIYDEDYPLAQYARIVIHPEISEDENEKDFKISFWEKSKYAKQLTITVDKDQSYKYAESVNLYTDGESGKIFKYEKIGDILVTEDSTVTKTSGKIVIGDYAKYDIFVKRPEDSDSWAVAVVAASETNKVLLDAAKDLNNLEPGEWCKIEMDVSDVEEAAYLIVRMPINAECKIFGYN